jgi:hypothetical protein
VIINLNNKQTVYQPFTYTYFHNILPSGILESAVEQANRFPFSLTEKTRAANEKRIWANQISGMVSAIGAEFDRGWVKEFLSIELEGYYRNCRTRVELCMDSVGSWLEPHQDDAAKVMTMQIYLSGCGGSTKMDTAATRVVPGSGWAFANYLRPVHSLPPLRYNRISIIVNYVNDDWRDQSVLF